MTLTLPEQPTVERVGVLLAVGLASLDELLGDDPHCLIPLGRQSVLEQWVAQLARAECKTVHIILHELAERVESIVGDGGRWGVAVRYHLARSRETALATLKRIAVEDHVLLADCTHFDDGDAWQRLVDSDRPLTLLDAAGQPTGIARLDAKLVNRLADVPRDEAPVWLAKHVGTAKSPHVFNFVTAAGILDAQQTLLDQTEGPLCPFRTDAPERIRVGRNVKIDPSAKVIEPVVLADHVTIGARAVVGPHAVLGYGAVVDDDATVQRSVVCAMTYVGSGLHVDESVLDGDRIAHARLGATLTIRDRALVDRMGQHSLRRRIGSMFFGFFAATLWLFTRPIAFVPGLTRGPVRSVRTHFLRRFVPGLWDVLRGRRRLVGPVGTIVPTPSWTPPTAEAGLVDELIVRRGRPGTPIETATSDAYYAAHASTTYDAKLLARYFARVVTG